MYISLNHTRFVKTKDVSWSNDTAYARTKNSKTKKLIIGSLVLFLVSWSNDTEDGYPSRARAD